MLRKFLMLCPALAFALPFIAATPSMARPLSIPAESLGWCWGGGNNCDVGEDLLLAVCTQTQIFVQTGQDNRAYDCTRCPARAASRPATTTPATPVRPAVRSATARARCSARPAT